MFAAATVSDSPAHFAGDKATPSLARLETESSKEAFQQQASTQHEHQTQHPALDPSSRKSGSSEQASGGADDAPECSPADDEPVAIIAAVPQPDHEQICRSGHAVDNVDAHRVHASKHASATKQSGNSQEGLAVSKACTSDASKPSSASQALEAIKAGSAVSKAASPQAEARVSAANRSSLQQSSQVVAAADEPKDILPDSAVAKPKDASVPTVACKTDQVLPIKEDKENDGSSLSLAGSEPQSQSQGLKQQQQSNAATAAAAQVQLHAFHASICRESCQVNNITGCTS